MATMPMSESISFVQGDDINYAISITQAGFALRTNGSTTLLGISTFWSASMVGCNILFPGSYTTFTIVSVQDFTHLTLNAAPTVTDTSPIQYIANVNISGWSIYFTVKDTLTPTSDTTATIEAPPVTVHVNPVQGESLLTLPHSITNVPDGSYYYDLRLLDGSGNVMSTRYGEVTVYPAVTQRLP